MRITDDILRASANNFTLVRLVLASSVIVSHCYWRVHGAETDPFIAIIGKPLSAYAVDGFFFLSGFLVYASLLRKRSVKDFTVARLTRIWPALIVSVAWTAIVGAYVTTLPAASYWTGQTAQFLFRNLTFIGGSFSLGGVVCGDQLCAVNGSLWTIPWEIRCYAALVLLFIMGLWSPEKIKKIVIPITIVCSIALHFMPGFEEGKASGIFYHLAIVDRLWTVFALGVGAYAIRDRIKLSWLWLLILFIVAMIEQHSQFYFHIDAIFTGYAVLCFGFLTARKNAVSGNWPDYSYGMYIYAFPVMMAISGLIHFEHSIPLIILNTIATVPLAAISWHLIEKPALDWSHGRRKRQMVKSEARL